MIKQSSQAVKTSVTNNSPFKGFLQPNNHSAQLSLAQTFFIEIPFFVFLLISTLKRENVKEYTASPNIFPSILLTDFEPDSSSFNGLVIDNRETKMVLCFYLAVSKKSAPSAPMTRSATRGSVASGKSSYHLHLPCSSTNSHLLLFPCLALFLFLFLYKCPSLN